MNTEDSEFKRLEHEALLRAAQPEQPECSTDPDAPHGFDRNGSHNNHRYTCDCEGWVAHPGQHALQERLAELHLYEEINEHYAKCNAGAENLRDWVAERMDTEPVQPATKSELNDAFAQGMSCRPASAQRPWVGLTEDEVALIAADCSLVTPSDFYFAQAIEARFKEKNT